MKIFTITFLIVILAALGGCTAGLRLNGQAAGENATAPEGTGTVTLEGRIVPP